MPTPPLLSIEDKTSLQNFFEAVADKKGITKKDEKDKIREEWLKTVTNSRSMAALFAQGLPTRNSFMRALNDALKSIQTDKSIRPAIALGNHPYEAEPCVYDEKANAVSENAPPATSCVRCHQGSGTLEGIKFEFDPSDLAQWRQDLKSDPKNTRAFLDKVLERLNDPESPMPPEGEKERTLFADNIEKLKADLARLKLNYVQGGTRVSERADVGVLVFEPNARILGRRRNALPARAAARRERFARLRFFSTTVDYARFGVS